MMKLAAERLRRDADDDAVDLDRALAVAKQMIELAQAERREHDAPPAARDNDE